MKTIIDQMIKMAEKYPKGSAATDEYGSYSYLKLNELSDLIAKRIIENSPSTPDGICIGIVLPRKKEILAAILGILRSGNYYVFIDPEAPKERSKFILRDAGVKCIISSKETSLSGIALKKHSVIFTEDIFEDYEKGERGDSINLSSPERKAFVTYTSGSTGAPKGVVNSYGYINQVTKARSTLHKLNKSDCVGNITNFSYAAVVFEAFPSVAAGSNQYIFSKEDILNQSQLIEKIIKNKVTAMFMVPSMLPLVLKQERELPLKCIFVAGEKAKNIPKTNISLFEIYGSSETGSVLWHKIQKKDPWNLLGKEYPGTSVYLLDKDGKLIDKPNVTGEACVVNEALSIEYMNLKEETEKKFTDCPYEPGKRMYHSGDMMWFDKEKNFYFAGRADGMININGQRVELGEIEAAVAGYKDILDAVCIVKKVNDRDVLVCFFIPAGENGKVSRDKLTKFLEKKLPSYMMPNEFINLPGFPKNVNGKTDREALFKIDIKTDRKIVKPKDDAEGLLLEEARRLLPDVEFGVTEDLFSFGMDSITAARFVAAIEEYIPEMTVSQVMRQKTIRKILSEKKEVISFYEKYDKKKPVLVLFHGIIPVSGLSNVYKKWSEVFNLLVIEPFYDHIYTQVGQYDFGKLVDYYLEIVKNKLPVNVYPWGFAGFSFGGELAVSVASKWYEKYGLKPYVFMGDTIVFRAYPGRKPVRINEIIPIDKLQFMGEESLEKEDVDRLQKAIDLMMTKKIDFTYDGPVIYAYAMKKPYERAERIKLPVIKALYKNVKLMNFPGFTHEDLYLKEEASIIFKNIFRMLLNNKR